MHGRLDILMNNAGVYGSGAAQDIETITMDEWRFVNDVNTDGVLLGLPGRRARHGEDGRRVDRQHFLESRDCGRRLELSPTAPARARCGSSQNRWLPIAAPKGYGIRCNSIHPGMVRTPLGNDVLRHYWEDRGCRRGGTGQGSAARRVGRGRGYCLCGTVPRLRRKQAHHRRRAGDRWRRHERPLISRDHGTRIKEKDACPFYRFEQFEDIVSNPHLSTGRGPIIEGDYMNLRLNNKDAGTGSKLHYHPNELMVFPLFGKIDSIVGERSPGRRIRAPSCILRRTCMHSMKATMDGTVSYLYVKDRTWSMVGVAADEAPPEASPVDRRVEGQKLARGEATRRRVRPEKSSEGIPKAPGDSYFPIVDGLDTPPPSAKRNFWIEGTRLAFGFVDRPARPRRHSSPRRS